MTKQEARKQGGASLLFLDSLLLRTNQGVPGELLENYLIPSNGSVPGDLLLGSTS